MIISRTERRTFVVIFTLAAIVVAGVYFFQITTFAAGMSGAIYTTTFNGQSVNENGYASKDAVYVNGGPQNEDINGLPDGTYYFQVTNPSGGVLLSTDPAVCRQLIVAFGKVAAAEGPACQHSTGLPNSANGSTPVKLAPFSDSPNNGAEYKVWLIRQTSDTVVAADGMHINFRNGDAKTDNFKVVVVPCTNCSPNSTLSGRKYYDVNGNAQVDPGEVPVGGVQIAVEVTVGGVTSTNLIMTDESGNWSLIVPTGADYHIGEFVPGTGPDDPDAIWAQTSPVGDAEGFQGYNGTANGDQTGLDFGNICFRVSGVATSPCSVSYEPPPTPTPTPEPTATPTPCTGNCPTSTLSGKKFYDVNANGILDGDEASIEGVRIAVVLTTSSGTTVTIVTTDESGDWSLEVPIDAVYLIGEYVPDAGSGDPSGSYWEQTAPAADDEGFRGYQGTATADRTGLDFGDRCFNTDSDGNPIVSTTPCGVAYPVTETAP